MNKHLQKKNCYNLEIINQHIHITRETPLMKGNTNTFDFYYFKISDYTLLKLAKVFSRKYNSICD